MSIQKGESPKAAAKPVSPKATAANNGIAKPSLRESRKEALRKMMMDLEIAKGSSSADAILETTTFLGRFRNLKYRTMLLRDCSAKTAAEAVITQVETFIAEVNKTSAI